MAPDVSVVIPAHLDGTRLHATLNALFMLAPSRLCFEVLVVNDGAAPEIKAVADLFPVRYAEIVRESVRWRNPGRAMNVGIRNAEGYVTIINHSGIVARTPFIEPIFEAVSGDTGVAPLARIEENGREVSGSQRPYLLLGGVLTAHLQRLRGYDEDFTEYGYEDDDLAVRLGAIGVRFDHRVDIVGEHLWHPRHDLGAEMERMRTLHYQKMEEFRAGRLGVERNLGREWGAI